MPFIPAIIGAVAEVAADVAGTAAATAGAEAAATTAASVGADAAATGASVGAEAAATGAEVGAEAGEVGAEAGEIGGEVGGEGTSMARNAADIGKQVFKGAKKADDVIQHLNNNNNNSGNNNSPGNVGIHPLSSAIDSMGGGSSFGSSDSLFQNPENSSEGPSGEISAPDRPSATRDIGLGLEEEPSYSTDIGSLHGSGNMRI